MSELFQKALYVRSNMLIALSQSCTRNEADISAFVRPASLFSRISAMSLFVIFMVWAADLCLSYTGYVFSSLDLTDSLVAKNLRVMLRMFLIEPYDETICVWVLMFSGFSFEDGVTALILPQVFFTVMMVVASLAAEQMAKHLCGLLILERMPPTTDATAPVDGAAPARVVERVVPAWQRLRTLWRFSPLVWLDYLLLAMGYQRLSDALAMRRVVTPRDDLGSTLRALLDERVSSANASAKPVWLARVLSSTTAIMILAMILSACAPDVGDMMPVNNVLSAMTVLRSSSNLGTGAVRGERVRVVPHFASARQMWSLAAPHEHATIGAVQHRGALGERRAYRAHDGKRLLLEVGDQLWTRAGLW
jgi:hypothetical protein